MAKKLQTSDILVTSVDMERNFPKYKYLLSNNCRLFNFDNKHALIVQCSGRTKKFGPPRKNKKCAPNILLYQIIQI